MIAVVNRHMPKSARSGLEGCGFCTLSLPPFSRLSGAVASHPDMLIFPLEDRIFVHRAYAAEAADAIGSIAACTGRQIVPIDTDVSPVYPSDIALNFFTIGKLLIGRIDRLPHELRTYAEEKGYRLISTRQGYAKCSTLVLGESAVITADPSIARAVRTAEADVLTVSTGNIRLDGYDHGFLGGATGVCGNTVYFCGDLASHPDAKAIADFCRAHGFVTHSLSDEPLYDVGSIYFL